MPEACARPASAANLRCHRRGGGAGGTGSYRPGSADEQGPGIAPRRCRRDSAAGFRVDDEPERHLPGDPAGVTQSRSHLARLRDAAKRSVLAHMDETGWKVNAQLCWLWGVVTQQITFCEILPGRGFEQAKSILGADYAGWLIHDGLQLYYKFLKAAHQSCAWHLIARCRRMIAASPSTASFPVAVKQLLEQALALRDRYLAQ